MRPRRLNIADDGFISCEKIRHGAVSGRGKTTEKNDDLIVRLVKIWNTRLRVGRLCGYAEQLADYGPAKPAKKGSGIDHIQEEADEVAKAHGEEVKEKKRNEYYQEDPLGALQVIVASRKLGEIIKKAIADAKAVLDKETGGSKDCY